MPEKSTAATQQKDQRMARRSSSAERPFSMLDRFAEEMDRVFDDFGFGRSWLSRSPFGMQRRARSEDMWWPAVEVVQRNNELVVKADLPGLRKDDIKVDVTDDAITISGERQTESQQDEGGVYRSERRYGSFSRTIPLPEGAITDQAKARFKDGVLEITVPAPPDQVTRGRRIEIGES